MKKKNYHINFEADLPIIIRDAVNNVFENFTTFLQFNKYECQFFECSVGIHSNNTFKLSKLFAQNIQNKEFHHSKWFLQTPLLFENNVADYIGTCFYMINCLQEYAPNQIDFLGRFDEEKSYQKKFNCFQENLVLDYFQEMAQTIFGKKIPLAKSTLLLSHDIDFIHSGWKQKIKNKLKNGEIFEAAKVVLAKLNGKDVWQNIDKIINLEHKHQISSTFFWIPAKGKTAFTKIENADYSLQEQIVVNYFHLIEHSPLHENALHKSISNNSIENELNEFPSCQKMRYHFLKFNIKEDYPIIENTNIKEEHSLGFSKNIGFRNSWGLPFIPINPLTMKTYSFKVFPIHVMDSALYYFMNKQSFDEMTNTTIQFINHHNSSCILSVLWHNNFVDLSNYEKFLIKLKSSLF